MKVMLLGVMCDAETIALFFCTAYLLPWLATHLTTFCRFSDRGHFQNTAQPEMLQVLKDKIQSSLKLQTAADPARH